jgi:hypothetical protein
VAETPMVTLACYILTTPRCCSSVIAFPSPVRTRDQTICHEPANASIRSPTAGGSGYSNPLFTSGDVLVDEGPDAPEQALVGHHRVVTPRQPQSPLVTKLRARSEQPQGCHTDRQGVRPQHIRTQTFGERQRESEKEHTEGSASQMWELDLGQNLSELHCGLLLGSACTPQSCTLPTYLLAHEHALMY